MRRATALILMMLLAFCTPERTKPLSEPGERIYTLNGTIVGRDQDDNTVRVSHERIGGFMEAMTMDFSVRGASVNRLPADGSRITAQLHVTDSAYWLTGVMRRE